MPRIGEHARRAVATCLPGARLADAQAELAATGGDVCVVINAQRVVLGIFSQDEIRGDPQRRVEDVMQPGPSTYRPNVTVTEMLERMRAHRLRRALVTTCDGVLIGLFHREETSASGGK